MPPQPCRKPGDGGRGTTQAARELTVGRAGQKACSRWAQQLGALEIVRGGKRLSGESAPARQTLKARDLTAPAGGKGSRAPEAEGRRILMPRAGRPGAEGGSEG